MTDAVKTDAVGTDAVSLKRYFKRVYGIPVRVETGKYKNPYIQVRIAPDRNEPGNFHAPLRYSHRFPDALGNACMRVVYPDSPGLSAQCWGGNVSAYSIAMHARHWVAVLAPAVDA